MDEFATKITHVFFFFFFFLVALDQVLFEDVLDGGGEESAILNEVFDGNPQGEDWINGYTSAEFY